MKSFIRFAVLTLIMTAVAASGFAGVIEGWTVLDSANIGTYADSNGSIIMYLTTDGPKAGERAIKIESTLKPGGYCGIWHNLPGANLKEGAVKFMAKSSKPGEMQMALKDKYNMQYVCFFKIPSTEWKEITVNCSDFKVDTTYTPPDAIKGKPMDFTDTKGMNFGSKTEGDASILIGPVSTGKPVAKSAAPAAAAPAAVAPVAEKPAAKPAKPAKVPKADAKAVEKTVAPAAAAPAAAAPAAPGKEGGVVESWKVIDGANTGTYADSNGSKVSFTVAEGPKSGEKAIKIDADLKTGGYLGIWHNISADLSKAGAIRFKAQSTVAGEVQIAVLDNNKVQYIAKFPVTTAWTDVTLNLSTLQKDPYYTPPDAILGKPMDLSVVKGMNFAPQAPGPSVLSIGPVVWLEGLVNAAAPAGAAAVAEAPKGTGAKVTLQEFAASEAGTSGTYADSTGSKIEYATKDAKKKGNAKDKMLSVNYTLVKGGYCGIWYRAGDVWDGVDCAGAVAIEMTVYSSKPMMIGMALKDKTNNQYVADGPMTKGGKWETVTIPVGSFVKDPYYTPPEAIKGAPQDLSQVKTFNIVPKTEGEATFAIDKIVVVK